MESVKFQSIDSLKFMNLEGMTLDSLPKLSVPLPQDEEPPEVFCPLQSGKPLSSESKQIILNVFIGLRVMFPSETIEGSIKKTSKLTGCSVRTVYRIRKETKENSGKPPSPLRLMKTAKRKRKTRKELYSDFIVSGIRNIVQGFFERNEVPTVKKIMQAINADDNFPNLSESTTSRLLKDIGLSHFLRSRDNALIKKGQQPTTQLAPLPSVQPQQQQPPHQQQLPHHHHQQQHPQQLQDHITQPQPTVQKVPPLNDGKRLHPGSNPVWCPPKTL